MTLSKKYCYDAQGKFWYLKISDVKEFVKEVENDFNLSADETDIWDNERWSKFKRIFLKKIKEHAGGEIV